MLDRRTLLRHVNARIREINERFGADIDNYQLLCECGTEQCLQRVEVPVSVYTEVFEREDGRFIVAPGHQTPEKDRLLVEAPTYALVAVHGAQ